MYYPPLAGILTAAAGVLFFLKYRTGWFLIVDGFVALIITIPILMSSATWRYWHAAWVFVTGAILICAAFQLRGYLRRVWLLGLAGMLFMLYSILRGGSFLTWRLEHFSYKVQIALLYLTGLAAFRSGVFLLLFALLARGRNPPELN